MTSLQPAIFWFPKDEHLPADWEDGGGYAIADGRVAVADGASAAYRAREWATHLVEQFIARPPAPDGGERAVLNWVSTSALAWQSSGGGDVVEWYHQDAERRGSFAAFVGAQFFPSSSGFVWHAVAVGDCCLFQVRADQLLAAFPLSRPAQFGNAPDLVPSAPDKLERLRGRVRTRSGDAAVGDAFVLCSDALAKFVVEEAGRGEQVWRVIGSITDNREFAELIRYLRRHDRIQVDDVTMLRLLLSA